MITPTIDLSNSKGLGIILITETNIAYSNQVGGTACLHPSQKGFYLPLIDEMVEQEEALTGFFSGKKWKGACSSGIDDETADFVDSVLEKSNHTKILKVDRSELQNSCEAWVRVNIDLSKDDFEEYKFLRDIKVDKGILTWMNSD